MQLNHISLKQHATLVAKTQLILCYMIPVTLVTLSAIVFGNQYKGGLLAWIVSALAVSIMVLNLKPNWFVGFVYDTQNTLNIRLDTNGTQWVFSPNVFKRYNAMFHMMQVAIGVLLLGLCSSKANIVWLLPLTIITIASGLLGWKFIQQKRFETIKNENVGLYKNRPMVRCYLSYQTKAYEYDGILELMDMKDANFAQHINQRLFDLAIRVNAHMNTHKIPDYIYAMLVMQIQEASDCIYATERQLANFMIVEKNKDVFKSFLYKKYLARFNSLNEMINYLEQQFEISLVDPNAFNDVGIPIYPKMTVWLNTPYDCLNATSQAVISNAWNDAIPYLLGMVERCDDHQDKLVLLEQIRLIVNTMQVICLDQERTFKAVTEQQKISLRMRRGANIDDEIGAVADYRNRMDEICYNSLTT